MTTNVSEISGSVNYVAETTGYLFLHIAKVGGTGTYRQLPESYTNRFRGTMGLPDMRRYEERFGLRLDFEILARYSLFVIDHMTIQELLDTRILPPSEFRNLEVVVYWRDPIDRFLSMCNHSNLSPREYYLRLVDPRRRTGWPKRSGWWKRTGWWKQSGAWLPREREHKILGRDSWYMTTCDILRYRGKMVSSTNVLMHDYKKITQIFKRHGIDVQLTSEKVNSPRKKYTQKHIEDRLRNQLEAFFREDIEVFNAMNRQQETLQRPHDSAVADSDGA